MGWPELRSMRYLCSKPELSSISLQMFVCVRDLCLLIFWYPAVLLNLLYLPLFAKGRGGDRLEECIRWGVPVRECSGRTWLLLAGESILWEESVCYWRHRGMMERQIWMFYFYENFLVILYMNTTYLDLIHSSCIQLPHNPKLPFHFMSSTFSFLFLLNCVITYCFQLVLPTCSQMWGHH